MPVEVPGLGVPHRLDVDVGAVERVLQGSRGFFAGGERPLLVVGNFGAARRRGQPNREVERVRGAFELRPAEEDLPEPREQPSLGVASLVDVRRDLVVVGHHEVAQVRQVAELLRGDCGYSGGPGPALVDEDARVLRDLRPTVD
ncbi:hypothetical protein ACFPRL_30500 [Pseudoclavibacter helvolus]